MCEPSGASVELSWNHLDLGGLIARYARLTPVGRLMLVMRIEVGRPVAHVAAEIGVSRPTAYKRWGRWLEGGVDNLVARSSRPRTCPHQTPVRVAREIEQLRRTLKLGPARIGPRLGVRPSTVHAASPGKRSCADNQAREFHRCERPSFEEILAPDGAQIRPVRQPHYERTPDDG
jgi:hypothetical protein